MSRYLNFTLVLLICCTCFARDPPTVNIPNQGTIQGREVSKSRIQKIHGYYAIPYAMAPVRNNRFAPPVTEPMPAWDGVRNATEYAPSCLQAEADFKKSEIPFFHVLWNKTFEDMSEDCLYLNVFVPIGKKRQQLTHIW